MNQTRRDHLIAMGALLGGSMLPLQRARALPAIADTSELIYVTPLIDGERESRCQAEVWFVRDGEDLLVVTAHDAWRARAITAGHDLARIWVGDVGVWSRNPEYRELPAVQGRAALVGDPAEHARALEIFGRKYTREWSTWGPRFRDGLAEGSRVLIRYRVG
jgi:hypothetical protein